MKNEDSRHDGRSLKKSLTKRSAEFISMFWLNIVTFLMVIAAIFMAVSILYHALLRFSYVSATSLAGIYASEYDAESGTIDYVFGMDRYMEGMSYFLCDKDGRLLFHDTKVEYDEETVSRFARQLIARIESGELGRYDDHIRDMEGRQRGVYHVRTQDGGWSIVTMPYAAIFGSLRIYIAIFSFIALMFLVANIVMITRALRERKQNERLISTIRALSNTYYGLYRVNYADHTYELVRGSRHVRDRMPDKGNYEDFLRTSGEVIEESAFRDFCDSFSIDNIKRLIQTRIRDFGGDFLRNFDGEYRWVNVSLRFDESLDKDEVLLCFREVNEAKQLQLRERQMLQDALEMSDRNMKARQAFFNNMSHDMRTPLNAILGMTGLAKDRLDDKAKVADYLSKIEFSGKQLLTLINDILDMSKAEQGRLSFNERAFSMSGTIEAALEPFRLQALSQSKDFHMVIEQDEWPVLGDPDRVVQIINIILSIAIKFTSPGDSISTRLSHSISGNTVIYTLIVRDTGIGMSKEFLPHLFEPYYQEDRFTSRSTVGTGLGMSIVYTLVNYMNGSIKVESEMDEGTEFTVTLTLLKAAEAPAAAPDTVNENASDDREPLKGVSILLAEDNEINMEIVLELLSAQGARVQSAWNGKEALESFEAAPEGSFDIILMDMQMPVMDGLEASRRLRALDRPDSRTIPIIAVTANVFSEDIAAQKAAGINDHVIKPIDPKELIRTIRGCLAGTRA